MSHLPNSENGLFMPFQAIIPGTSQVKAFTSATGMSAVFQTRTAVVRLIATQACHVKFAQSPTAVADGTCVYVPAGVECYFGVTGGQRLAVIRDSADGNLFITEGA